jgi:leucyl/phenylalanyl-tRNA--protein transferase
MEAWGFEFLDCQMPTEHLARFGAREWPRDGFLRVLRRSVNRPTRRGRWQLSQELMESKLRERPAKQPSTGH